MQILILHVAVNGEIASLSPEKSFPLETCFSPILFPPKNYVGLHHLFPLLHKVPSVLHQFTSSSQDLFAETSQNTTESCNAYRA